MAELQIKVKDQVLFVTFSSRNFDTQWKSWNEKLQQLSSLCQGMPEVFFYFPQLSQQKVMDCLNDSKEIKVIGFQNRNIYDSRLYKVFDKVRGGESVSFIGDTLIVGDIAKDAYISLKKGNLYVMGRIYGKIHLLNENSRIYCQKMMCETLCINGNWQSSTKFEALHEYDKNEIQSRWRKNDDKIDTCDKW